MHVATILKTNQRFYTLTNSDIVLNDSSFHTLSISDNRNSMIHKLVFTKLTFSNDTSAAEAMFHGAVLMRL